MRLFDLGVDLFHFLFHLGRDACGLWDELDQVFRLPQQIADVGDIRQVAFAVSLRRDGLGSGLLDQLAGADDPFGGGDKLCHEINAPH